MHAPTATTPEPLRAAMLAHNAAIEACRAADACVLAEVGRLRADGLTEEQIQAIADADALAGGPIWGAFSAACSVETAAAHAVTRAS